jgi:hypothetical protein
MGSTAHTYAYARDLTLHLEQTLTCQDAFEAL